MSTRYEKVDKSVARFGRIDRSIGEPPCARRCRRTDARNVLLDNPPGVHHISSYNTSLACLPLPTVAIPTQAKESTTNCLMKILPRCHELAAMCQGWTVW